MKKPTHNFNDYAFEIAPLSDEDGGGYLITFPDLPGCMADGETPDEAMREGREAFDAWIAAQLAAGREVPAPHAGRESGKFVARVPRSLHSRLAARARAEGVSMNTLIVALLSEGAERHV